MNDAEDNNLRIFYFENDMPTHAGRFPINFCFGWDFFTFMKSKRILFNTPDGFKNFITNTNCINGLMFYESNVTCNLINVAECVFGNL